MSDFESVPLRHVAIEGVLKCGKTKLAKVFAEKLGGQPVFDRIDNPYLKDFYEEKEGGAFLAQLVFLVNRYHQQARLLQRDLFSERIFCDYLFEKDKIYAYQTLTDDELIVYEKIFGIFSERIAKPDLTVYLQISLQNLLRRIDKRGTALEKNISEKYLEDIIGAFDYFFFNYHSSPLLVIRADELDFNREEVIDDLIEKIGKMKTSPLFYVPLGRSETDQKKER
jgi:deoxyadenosine/deoxycytidine kinase